MKYCKFCGSELQDDDRFCSHCGKCQDDIVDRPDNFRGHSISDGNFNMNNNINNTNMNNSTSNKGRSYAITGLILAFIIPLVGIIFSALSLRYTPKGEKNVMGIVGLVLSIIFFLSYTIYINLG